MDFHLRNTFVHHWDSISGPLQWSFRHFCHDFLATAVSTYGYVYGYVPAMRAPEGPKQRRPTLYQRPSQTTIQLHSSLSDLWRRRYTMDCGRLQRLSSGIPGLSMDWFKVYIQILCMYIIYIYVICITVCIHITHNAYKQKATALCNRSFHKDLPKRNC